MSHETLWLSTGDMGVCWAADDDLLLLLSIDVAVDATLAVAWWPDEVAPPPLVDVAMIMLGGGGII